MESLFRAIREASNAGSWSRGVELVRLDAVVGIGANDDEVEFQVAEPGRSVARGVFLYPDDDDWSCECDSIEDACYHVTAAVIAWRQAKKQGDDLPQASGGGPGRVTYHLRRRADRLALHRGFLEGGEEKPLTQTLASLGSRVVVTQRDAQLETLVTRYGEGPLPPQQLQAFFDQLREADGLDFEGEPVQLEEPTTGLRLRIEDCAAGIRVTLEQDPVVDELFANRVVREGNVLRPIKDAGFSERERDRLRQGEIFDVDRKADLVGDLIPRWEEKVPVVVEATSLPKKAQARPRLQIQTTRVDNGLEVLAHVVYGEPAVARVDGDNLTLLGDGPVPERDRDHEARLLRTLRRETDLQPGVRQSLPTGRAVAWVQWLEREPKLQKTLAGDAHREFGKVTDLEFFLGAGATGIDLGFAGGGRRASGGGAADPAAVLRAWDRGEDYVPLLDGGFGRIPTQWLQLHHARVAALLRAREGRENEPSGLAAWAFADLAALCEDLNQTPPFEVADLRQKLGAVDEGGSAELPDYLRGYQREGVTWLRLMGQAGLGALLADDMGLGKTLQTICAITPRSEEQERSTLVVAPTSVVFNWRREIEKFRSELNVCVYHGAHRTLDPQADVVVTTYALLRLDLENLGDVDWELVVLDEAQAIKNPTSQTARAAFDLTAGRRIALTGTPVENRLEDLWSQMHFLNRGLLEGRQEFHERFAKGVAQQDEDSIAGLRDRIRPFVLRRLKTEVAPELPPRTEAVLECELTSPERATYDAIRAATRDEILKKLGADASTLQVLEALLRLRQAACHPALVPGFEGNPATGSSKTAVLVDALTTAAAEGSKALVFSQWTSMLDLIGPQLDEAGVGFNRLDGSTRDREAVVNAFQKPEGPPVMLLSLKAGGTGLNLTAADHVFIVDPWWNPAVEDQAADRAHRIGQDKPVMVYRLVARDTVEQQILELQQRKRALADAALGEGAVAAPVTRDELLALLG